MKITVLTLPGLVLGLAIGAFAQAPPTKIGIIHIQNAILSTKEGQKAAQELQSRMDPKRKELERQQSEIQSLQTKLRSTSNTASEEVRNGLTRDIDAKTKSYNRSLEDAQAEFEQEQQKVLQDLGSRLMAVIDKYATDNGFAVILDVSSQQTPVLYAANSVDVTRAVVEMYDKAAPASATPAAAAPPAAAPKPVAPKPVAPVKK